MPAARTLRCVRFRRSRHRCSTAWCAPAQSGDRWRWPARAAGRLELPGPRRPLRHRFRVCLQRLERRRRRFFDRDVVARQRRARFAERAANARTSAGRARAARLPCARLRLSLSRSSRRCSSRWRRARPPSSGRPRRRCLRASPAGRGAGTAPARRRASCRASGLRPISCSVLRIRSSDTRSRYGDCAR